MIDGKKLGKKIKKRRLQLGLKQYELADMCNFCVSYIRQIESGQKIPSLDFLLRIANALEISVDVLVKDDLEHQELIYMRDIEERIKKLPTSAKIGACESISNLLEIFEQVYK